MSLDSALLHLGHRLRLMKSKKPFCSHAGMPQIPFCLSHGSLLLCKIWQPPTLPCRLQHSTIGRPGLNRRVRDGYGCFPGTHRRQKDIRFCFSSTLQTASGHLPVAAAVSRLYSKTLIIEQLIEISLSLPLLLLP